MADNPAWHSKLTSLAQQFSAREDTSALSAAVYHGRSDSWWTWEEPQAPQLHFLASTTKLYTTAIVAQLIDQGAFALNTPVHTLVEPATVDSIHTLGGTDRSHEITVEHLLRHSSGLPDYFEDKRTDGGRLFDDLLRRDQSWTVDDALEWARGMTPAFAPGTPGRAHYSDTNFQLLGRIIEVCDGRTFAESVHHRIAAPLGLTDTWLYSPSTQSRFQQIAPLVYGTSLWERPLAMGSFGADGSMVSTATETVTFLRALWSGELTDLAWTDRWRTDPRRVFFPLEYGLGVMRYHLPRWMTLSWTPEMWGHSGASGVVAYWSPDHDAWLTLCINQVKSRSLVYRFLSRMVREIPRL